MAAGCLHARCVQSDYPGVTTHFYCRPVSLSLSPPVRSSAPHGTWWFSLQSLVLLYYLSGRGKKTSFHIPLHQQQWDTFYFWSSAECKMFLFSSYFISKNRITQNWWIANFVKMKFLSAVKMGSKSHQHTHSLLLYGQPCFNVTFLRLLNHKLGKILEFL